MFLFRENAQRKYIDLIKEAASRWPNWDPPIIIYVGPPFSVPYYVCV
jgi:hypothetical protein